MSAALTLELGLDRRRTGGPVQWRTPREPAPAAGRRDRPTLDDLVVGAWEGLLAHRPVGCPVCGAAMRPRPGSGASAVGGRCGGCGTTLG